MRTALPLLAAFLLTFAARAADPEQRVIYPASPRDRPNYRIPALLRAANNDLICFAERRNDGPGDIGNHDMVAKRSTDRGQTWSDEILIYDGGNLSNVDSTPLLDRDTSRVFLFFLLNKRQFAYCTSDDAGRTWTVPVIIHDQVTRSGWNALGDKQRYGVGPSGGAIQLRPGGPHAGRIIVPARHNAIAPGAKSAVSASHVFYSDDHGQTWRLSDTDAAPEGNECQLVELADHTILINARDGDNARRPDRLRRIIATSPDGGQTWTNAHRDDHLPEVQVEGCTLRYSLSDGDRGRNLLLFSNPLSTTRTPDHPYGRFDVGVRFSTDEAKTWSPGKPVYRGPSSYTSMAVLDDQSIAIAFEAGPPNGKSYWSEIRVARFTLDWLTAP